MTIAIYSPNGSISAKHNSHRSAWVHMRVDQLQRQAKANGLEFEFVLQPKSLEGFDAVFIYNGMETDISSPSHPIHSKKRGPKDPPLNMFGGLAPNWPKYEMLGNYKGDLRWLDFPLDYPALIAKRSDAGDYYNELVALKNVLDDIECVGQPFSETVVLGDSHAISSYVPGAYVQRLDFMTMRGFIKRTVGSSPSLLPTFNFNKLIINFGNIDLRHHMARSSYPDDETASNWAYQYAEAISMYVKQGYEVEVHELMPVEPETRKVAQTGWFKGTPWYGSAIRRQDIRHVFNARLKVLSSVCGFTVYEYPEAFYDKKGLLPVGVMEANKGVHLAWSSSRMMRGDF